MNTLKFQKINKFATEQHNLEVFDIKKTKVFSKELEIYSPCNLTIFITNLCNCNCFFCINRDNEKIVDIDDDLYYKALEETLNELNPNDFEITITGGESTLNKDRFVKTMEMCHKKGFRFRTISTNGTNLLSDYEDIPLCEHMIRNDAIHNINISSMDINRNIDIFKNKTVTSEDIKKLAYFYNLNKAEMRISCNLINNYVDSMDKILEFVDYYDNLGVPSIMFREIVGNYNSPKLDDVFIPCNLFKKIDELNGDIYKVDVYKYKDFVVKHYIQKGVSKYTNNLVLVNGKLKLGFNGEVIKRF